MLKRRMMCGTVVVLVLVAAACPAVFAVEGDLVWSTFLGGSTRHDHAQAIAVDEEGNVYVAGNTPSADFPTPGGYDTTLDGERDAFVSKFSSDGNLLWSTYLGGGITDSADGLAVDGAGHVYVTGGTWSADFPTPGGYDTSLDIADGFLCKFSPDGDLLWSTYVGIDPGGARAVALDVADNVYVTGFILSSFDPGTILFDAFVAKFDGNGIPQWSICFGGSENDEGLAIATDGAGDVYVTGPTASVDIATPGGYDATLDGERDAFLSKYDGDGILLWSTYVGGSGNEWGSGVAVDEQDSIFIGGHTDSNDFATPGADDTTLDGEQDAFLSKVDTDGVLLWSSYLGGNGYDEGQAIASDGAGSVYVTGMTRSTDFPTPGGYDTTYNGGDDCFVSSFSTDGSLLWSTYLGGSEGDRADCIATDGTQSVYIAGSTGSSDFPTPEGYDTTLDGEGDAFIARFGGSDSDGDGLRDAAETNTGVYADETDTGTDPDNPDSDGDGLSDGEEVYTYLTDPNAEDTDGDGFLDGVEVAQRSDPNDPGSIPMFARGGSGEPCFIATAAYGSPAAKDVGVLRDFRDTYLLSNRLGTACVIAYYKLSVPVARIIADHEPVRMALRVCLKPLAVLARIALESSRIVGLVTGVGLATLAVSSCLFVRRRSARLLR